MPALFRPWTAVRSEKALLIQARNALHVILKQLIMCQQYVSFAELGALLFKLCSVGVEFTGPGHACLGKRAMENSAGVLGFMSRMPASFQFASASLVLSSSQDTRLDDR